MRSVRVSLVVALVTLMVVGGVPFSSIDYVKATPEVVEAEVDITTAETSVTGGQRRTEPTEAPIAFTGLWVVLPEEVESVNIRTSADGDAWEPWEEVEMLHDEEGPDPGSLDDGQATVDLELVSELVLLDEARWFQVELPTEVDELQVKLVDSTGLNDSLWVRAMRALPRPAVAEASSTPSWIRSRSQWGARSPAGSIGRASTVRQAIVHHTASSSTYTRDQVPGQLRNIQAYHMGLGWSDIGYNILIDRFGRVWEGRAGGLDRAVIGAHARGFNTGSVGISVLGNYAQTDPNTGVMRRPTGTVLDAISRTIGWQASVYGFDPQGRVTINGTSYPRVVGHRDVGNTTCPATIHDYLSRIRRDAAAQAYPFPDIAGSTHASAIVQLYGEGIVSGYANGTFRPDRVVTRAEVATLLSRAFNIAPVSGRRFSDVPRNSTHEGAINALADRGILNGYTDGTFRPDRALRRDHMAAILQRTLGLQRRPNDNRFVDLDRYVGEINAIAHAGVTQGCATNPPRYCPARSVTRGEMASFLLRARAR